MNNNKTTEQLLDAQHAPDVPSQPLISAENFRGNCNSQHASVN